MNLTKNVNTRYKMSKNTFSQKDYDQLLNLISNYHETSAIVSAVDAMELIIKGILTGRLSIKLK